MSRIAFWMRETICSPLRFASWWIWATLLCRPSRELPEECLEHQKEEARLARLRAERKLAAQRRVGVEVDRLTRSFERLVGGTTR